MNVDFAFTAAQSITKTINATSADGFLLTNTTAANLFLNADSFNLATIPPSAIDDSPFFTNAPLFLGPNAATGTIGLFNITIPNGTPLGDYLGTFQVLGGPASNDQTLIGSAGFTVHVQAPSGIPEPSSLSMVALAGALLVVLRRRAINRNSVRYPSGR